MNRHAEIAPLNTSFVHSTLFPSPCGNGLAESGKTAGMSPPRRSSSPPLLPYSQIPRTHQPIGSQSFIPGASLPQSISQPSPVFSFGSFPPMSPAPSSFRDSPSAKNKAALPPLPFTRRTTSGASGSSLPPRKVHRRAISDNVSDLNSLMRLIYPKAVEMPVGVMKSMESRGGAANVTDEYVNAHMELDNVMNFATGDDVERVSGYSENWRKATSGVKRRACTEYTPISRSVSVACNLNGNSSFGGDESPNLPPSPGNLQGVTNSVDGYENAWGLEIEGGVFTVSEIEKIMCSEKLKELAVCNPKHVKRILANRESAARSKENKARHLNELHARVEALQNEVATLSADNILMERCKLALEDENKQLRIRVQAMEDEAKLRDALIHQLTGEVQRLKLATGEVMHNLSGYDGPNRQSLDADMFQQPNINQQPQMNLGFE